MEKSKNKLEELFGIDLRSLALFRICLGLIVLYDLIIRAQDLKAFYTDEGVLPRTVLIEKFLGPWTLSIHTLSGNFYIQAVLFLISGLFAISLIIGYRTRFVTFISWFLLISLQARNPTFFFLGDQLLRLFLFWGIFLPLGACWSIDSKENKSEFIKSKIVLSPASCALLAQVVFLYVFSAFFKTAKEWHDGSAVFYALSVEQYQTPIGIYLLNYPELTKFLTKFTLYLELYGPLLFFIPICTYQIRLIVVFAFFLLQVGFGLSMTLDFFPFVSSLGMIPFLPSRFLDKVLPKISSFISPHQDLKNLFKSLVNLLEEITKTLIPISFGASRFIPKSIENVLVSFLLIYVFLWNLSGVTPKYPVPENLKWVGNLLNINQRWDMFAPGPYKQGGFYVFVGTLIDGTEIDVLKDGEKVSFEKPKLVSRTFKNNRWRAYFMKMWDTHNKEQIIFFCKYVCDTWNKTHSKQKLLKSIQLNYLMEKTVPYEKGGKIEKIMFWEHFCLCNPQKEDCKNKKYVF